MTTSSAASTHKEILVTGGCGYLGSALLRWLGNQPGFAGSTIRVLDNMQHANYAALMDLPAQVSYKLIEGDILDPNVVALAMDGADAVIHLASVVGTPMGFERPAWQTQVNRWGTTQLVNAAVEAGIGRFVFASTAAVYGPSDVPVDEAFVSKPVGAYAQSKVAAEDAIRAAGQRGLTATILRFGSIFGYAPVTRFSAVANRFAYLAGAKGSITIFGTGEQRRPFVHVSDACRAIEIALLSEAQSGVSLFNIVSHNSTISELARLLEARYGTRIRYGEQDIRTHYSFSAESSRARTELGWEPAVTMAQGLYELCDKFR